MFKNRLYKSGTGWCFWRWTFVDSEYITRLHLFKTPWCALCVHWLNKPDPEPYLHDHPVSFLSIILFGGYWEKRFVGDENRSGYRGIFNYVRASDKDRHSIVRMKPGTVTLAFMGPKTREWGYHTPDGWVHWKAYHHAQRLQSKESKESKNDETQHIQGP